MMNDENTKALILLGGKSTRMGRVKYTIEIDGQRQYERIAHFLKELGVPCFFSVSESQVDNFDQWENVLVDIESDMGPMGGIVTAIQKDPTVSWLVIACDLLHLQKSTLHRLLSVPSEGYDVVTYQIKDSSFPETTCTLYHPGSYAPLLSQVEAGQYSLQSVLKVVRVKFVTVENGYELKNANYPEDI